MRCSLRCLLLVGLLSILPVPAGNDDEAKETWIGVPRAEIVKVLGEPDKVKKDKQGNELLVYKLVRVAPDAYPGPGMLLVDVPEVGLVGRRLPTPDPALGNFVVPFTATDSEGRPVDPPGSIGPPHFVPRNIDAGGVESTMPGGFPEGDGLLGRLTLKLRVGADGRITEVALPKKHRKPEGE